MATSVLIGAVDRKGKRVAAASVETHKADHVAPRGTALAELHGNAAQVVEHRAADNHYGAGVQPLRPW